MSDPFTSLLDEAARLIRSSSHGVVFTGAGISTPSGIPDFRSQNSGLWNKVDPFQVASLTAFRRQPERFYDWLRSLLVQIWQAKPNAGHQALAQMEQRCRIHSVLTQNIDHLHQSAGSKEVVELHGTLESLTCPRCRAAYPMTHFKPLILEGKTLPRCTACHSVLKPDIILFEESLPENAWRKAEDECQQTDLILVVGSSLEVTPAALLPRMALENGAQMIIVNLTPTHLDPYAAVVLPMNGAEALPDLLERML